MAVDRADLEVEPAAAARRGPLRYAGRIVAIVVAALFVGLLVYGLISRSENTSIDDSLAKAQPIAAPALSLPLLEPGSPPPALARRIRRAAADGRVSLSELRGIPIVLNFWASWCTPCRQESPLLERTWKAHRGDGSLLLGLDMQDVTDDARAFVRAFGISYPIIRDQGNDVAHEYGVSAVPETFFISRQGKVVGHVIGVASPAQLRDGISAAASGRVAGVRQGGAKGATSRAPPPARKGG